MYALLTLLIYVQDGILNDTDEALQAVLDSSNLPLSIVIVGIGPADFTAMVITHINSFPTFYFTKASSRSIKIHELTRKEKLQEKIKEV